MAKLTFKHSRYWLKKLAAHRFSNIDISLDESLAITAHIKTCPECARIHDESIKTDNELMELISTLPVAAPHFPEGLSPRLQQLWDEEDANGKPADSEHLIRERLEQSPKTRE